MTRAVHLLGRGAAFACVLMPLCACAADFSLTGFATLGYAVSDQSAAYLRYIDDRGTLKADSVVGLQGEARFNPQWSATLQAVLAAPQTRDEDVEATIRWAFVAYRPTNEWLFRAGRLRPPVFINTQNSEVGVTYDQARLPAEVYSLSPVYDVDGAAVTRTWQLERAELNVDAYWGRRNTKFRLPFQRESGQSGAYFAERLTFTGIALSYATASLTLRGGLHHAAIKPRQPLYETFVPMTIPGPFGGTLYVPGNALAEASVKALTLGLDWRSGPWRVTSEYGHRHPDNDIGPESKSAYVTVARSMGQWTPYVTVAGIRSGDTQRALYNALNATPVPAAAQFPPPLGPGLSAQYHRTLADQVFIADQHSTMLGVAYAFSATSKVKLEWMRTRVGLASAFVDGDVHDKSFNVFSASYSVAF